MMERERERCAGFGRVDDHLVADYFNLRTPEVSESDEAGEDGAVQEVAGGGEGGER
jgi:hypothetical protein